MQASGTNFLEWTLINNFDIDYNGECGCIGNVIGDDRYQNPQSLKHCLPNLENGRPLIIQRDYDEWKISVKKRITQTSYTYENYKYYYDTPKREGWDEKDYILVNHRWAYKNYEELLKIIQSKFGYKFKKDWEQPMKRTIWDGGKTLSNIDFKIED